MPFKSYREESKINWGKELCEKQHPDKEDLQFGCLLRIADATELMAKNHQRLLDERDRYKIWYEQERKTNQRLLNSNAGLRGYIKRLKK